PGSPDALPPPTVSMPGRPRKRPAPAARARNAGDEAGARPRGALHVEIAAGSLRRGPGDGKAEPAPARIARPAFVHPIEALEDAAEVAAFDARAIVLHLDAEEASILHRPHANPPAGGCELHRVVEKVADHDFDR